MDIIENKLLLTNTECFLEALKQSSQNSRSIILNDLKNPIYIEKSSIDNATGQYRTDPRYKEILADYK
jgi:hypothetical protein